MRRYQKFSAMTIALGGLLYGYDTGVINGALLFMRLKDQFDLKSGMQGLVSSILILGGGLGALFSGYFADRFGRRRPLNLVALLFVLATLGSAFSSQVFFLLVFRFLLGLAVGSASALTPIYLGEISTQAFQTQNINRNAVAIVLGQLLAFVVNALLGNLWGNWHGVWRLMVLAAVIPAMALWLGTFIIPDSPKWQLLHGHKKAARATFQKLGFSKAAIVASGKRAAVESSHLSWAEIWGRKSWLVLLGLGIGLALVQQISGVNTVMYYGSALLEEIGLSRGSSLDANILIGSASFAASVIGTRLINHHDPKRLLLGGLLGNAISMGLLFGLGKWGSMPFQQPAILFALTAFLVSHQGLVSPTTWLLLSNQFPLPVCARFMAIATTVIWLSNFVISLTYPVLMARLGIAMTFLVFALANAFSFLFVVVFVLPLSQNPAK